MTYGENEVHSKEIALAIELQQQRGMLWLLGEVMKVANNIDSFKELMAITTDMLLGVTGVNTCFVWAYHNERTKLYLRSTVYNNQFLELDEGEMKEELKMINKTTLYGESEIIFPIVGMHEKPKSRLVIPLHDYKEEQVIGGFILEQEQALFFTRNEINFFETLGVFIGSNAKNSKLFEKVSEESDKDTLTGVYNRRQLEKIMIDFMTSYEQVAVAIMDVDNLKPINDLQGHLKGDNLLKAVALCAKNLLESEGGKVFRYGGDEFLLILPKHLDEAIEVFSMLQKRIPTMQSILDLGVSTSITVGVSFYPDMADNLNTLIHLADLALYEGKGKGKNCMVVADMSEDRYCHAL